jgi:hypothetical protein
MFHVFDANKCLNPYKLVGCYRFTTNLYGFFHIVSSKKLPSPNLSPFRKTGQQKSAGAPWHRCLLDSQTKEGALVFACVRQLFSVRS